MVSRTQDDAFREIQLNGKQLVFLFMVATVFSVVVFLCGVFVGRGVRAERAPLVADSTGASAVTTPDVVASQEPVATPVGSDPTAAAPPPAVDELSYFNRLDKAGSTTEELKPASPPAAAAARQPAPGAAPPPAKESKKDSAKDVPKAAVKDLPKAAVKDLPKEAVKAAPASPPKETNQDAPKETVAAAEPTGPGFALQVTALREKAEAETIARRLSAKGYTAYVMTPAKGSPAMYRVRVGKFKTRREAEATATRLQKEEQFTPWVTR
jgi:cell division septation protein DedD